MVHSTVILLFREHNYSPLNAHRNIKRCISVNRFSFHGFILSTKKSVPKLNPKSDVELCLMGN